MIIKPCKCCGALPTITDDCGIGDVFCKYGCYKTEYGTDKTFHFSGKFKTKKADAIKAWNKLNTTGERDEPIY